MKSDYIKDNWARQCLEIEPGKGPGKVSANEVFDLLIEIGEGLRKPIQVYPRPDYSIKGEWNINSGQMIFIVGGWTLAFFIDCGAWDNIDYVIAPDGRRGECEDWGAACQPDTILDHYSGRLSDKVEKVFMHAPFVNIGIKEPDFDPAEAFEKIKTCIQNADSQS